MKKGKLPKLTPAEFEIMDAVWSAGELTVRGIIQKINEAHKRNPSRSTIQVQAGRLEGKGWLIHRQEGNRFIYQPTAPRSEASTTLAFDIGDRIFGGSFIELAKAFFNHSAISSDEIRQLRELIDNYKE